MYPTLEITALLVGVGVFAEFARADHAAGRRRWACAWLSIACALCVASMGATAARHYGWARSYEAPIPPARLQPHADGTYTPPVKPPSELFGGAAWGPSRKGVVR